MRFKVSEADKGDFAKGALAWDVLQRTAMHNFPALLPSVVDLSDCLHLKPYSVACLAALGIRSGRQSRLIWPNDAECRNHLARLELHQFFVVEDVPCVVCRDTNVPVQQLEDQPGGFANRAMSIWAREAGGLPAGMQREFENHLDEMIYNALGHSESPVGCIVVGQAFPHTGTVDVTILDLGIGIRAHLTRNPAHADIQTDEAAVATAICEGVTGTAPGRVNRLGQPNSGVGLTSLVSFCDAGGGNVSICSGSFCGTSSAGVRTKLDIKRPLPGTLVNIQFSINAELPDQHDNAILL